LDFSNDPNYNYITSQNEIFKSYKQILDMATETKSIILKKIPKVIDQKLIDDEVERLRKRLKEMDDAEQECPLYFRYEAFEEQYGEEIPKLEEKISIQGCQLSDINKIILRMQNQIEEQSKIIFEQQSSIEKMKIVIKTIQNQIEEQYKSLEQSTLENDIERILNGDL